MPASCSAYGCTNRFKTGGPLQFFGFPLKNTALLKAWLGKVRRKDFIPSKSSKLCSNHFADDDYLVRPGTYVRKLKPDAVPSIFYIPTKLERNNIKNSLERAHLDDPKLVASVEEIPVISTSNYTCNDSLPLRIEISTTETLNKEIQTEEDYIENSLKLQVNILRKKIRRRNQNVKSFISFIKTLRQKGLLQQKAEYLLIRQLLQFTL